MSQKILYTKGQRFGRWTIISECGTPDRGGVRWTCQCDCGTISHVLSSKLRRGISTSCGCVRNEQTSNRLWTGCGKLSGVHWNTILRSAKQRNIEVTITIQDAWDLFNKQNQTCALTGLPLTMFVRKTATTREGSASLDRIDSTKGYHIDNVHWVHKHVNKMKMEFPLDYFISLCQKVVDYSSTHRDNTLIE